MRPFPKTAQFLKKPWSIVRGFRQIGPFPKTSQFLKKPWSIVRGFRRNWAVSENCSISQKKNVVYRVFVEIGPFPKTAQFVYSKGVLSK